jgi:hypothetical protein
MRNEPQDLHRAELKIELLVDNERCYRCGAKCGQYEVSTWAPVRTHLVGSVRISRIRYSESETFFLNFWIKYETGALTTPAQRQVSQDYGNLLRFKMCEGFMWGARSQIMCVCNVSILNILTRTERF